jgi:O-antigen ligase
VIPGLGRIFTALTSGSLSRSTFWVLLMAVAGGQLMFNHTLSSRWRFFLGLVLAAVLLFAFYREFHTLSTWAPIVVVIGILAWLRWANFRRAVLVLSLVALFGSGLFFSTVYELAGGDDEWVESGGSRLVLIGRVLEVTMRNPITGLGPASYRPYVNARPLQYEGAFWIAPMINSHNNYVDLFSQTGLLGLGIFFWFAVEMGLLGWRLSMRHTEGFLGGYVNGVFAAWIASLVLMMLADWILPFVYNIGFYGFQASILVWLFLGGLLAVEQWTAKPAVDLEQRAAL